MEKFWAEYIRVSTDMQTERDSLLNQEERIVAYAKAQKKPYQIYSENKSYPPLNSFNTALTS
jgi:DNA invertase Pin-like site-specific DNA recombinase